jgi:predicted PolB exonuclease-like 3'-5' exonuclease
MKTLTVDIETIAPDWSDEEKPFPPLPYHLPVVVGILESVDGAPRGVETYIIGQRYGTERAVLDGVFSRLATAGRLVTFNGRAFDLPVLTLRALHHGIDASATQSRAHRFPAHNKPLWHRDLLDLLTNYGAGTRFSLDALCSQTLDLPGKPPGVDGSKVGELYAKDPQLVADYCADDVLQTHIVYLQWLVTGEGLPEAKVQPAILESRRLLAKNREKFLT